jgi:hypothetical protein
MIVIVLLLVLAGGGWYVYTGYLRPARACRKCRGLGFRPFIGRTYTECRRCGGYGRVLRPAARHVAHKRARPGKRGRALPRRPLRAPARILPVRAPRRELW